MTINGQNYRSALADFNSLRLKAAMQEIIARLTGKSNELLSYDEVAARLKLNARSERGIFDIPLDSIVGSVGRYQDFTRSFLPLQSSSQERDRWARVKLAIDDISGAGWPPIDVYKVGEVYFVLDGNHRVSVARKEGFNFIQAHVIEVKTDIPLLPDVQPDDLIVKAEYADFLDKTNLKDLIPEADLSLTVPGQYDRLLEHIKVHQYYMGLDFQRDITDDEALEHWYKNVYTSIVDPLIERGLLHWFPGRTLTDLYLWISEHRTVLEQELGWQVPPDVVIDDLLVHENPKAEDDITQTGQWRINRESDHFSNTLFRDILVPISGEEQSWQALEQALIIARYEEAALHGLHIVSPRMNEDSVEWTGIKEKFEVLCSDAGQNGTFSIEKGEITELICQRSVLTDLLVLNIIHPPEPGLSSLGSGLRSIIWRSARPILTIPGAVSPLDNALVAYDGSTRSKEAVFLAAYLAQRWNTRLTVMTITDNPDSDVQEFVRAYFKEHEIEADFLLTNGGHEQFLVEIKNRNINLVLLGSYSGNALQEIFLGSAVNYLLRNAACPMLICR